MHRASTPWLASSLTALALTASVSLAQAAQRAEAADARTADARTADAGTVDGGHVLAPLSDERRLDLGALEAEVPSPAAVLGYELGSRFSAQGKMLAYLERLAEASDRVRLWEYGRSYEDRPLVLLAVSSEENLERLEEIRERQLALANDAELSRAQIDELIEAQPAVVWLAYGIHGNESSSSEVAMATAYALAAATGEWEDILRKVVVLIDPLMNPDGRERYVQGFVQRAGQWPDPSGAGLEHQEPWPGGRFNHYLIDLNRDWAWASQVETRARLAAYRRWEPQVFADFHEMSSESSYFFPPAAEPILSEIDPRTVAWLDRFGRANGAAFDRQGWLYYKAQNFDLFYPGYGDTYPSLRGAVGMTYEVAGGGYGGLLLERRSGDTRSLADRIGRHFTAALTTVRVAAQQRRELLEDFAAIRRRSFAQNPRSYLWSPDSAESAELAQLLRLHGIEVGRLGKAARLSVSPFVKGPLEERSFAEETFVVSSSQPLGGLARTLLDREAQLPAGFIREQRQRLERNLSPEFYDITAWSLPLAFGVETWMLDGEAPAVVAGGEPASAMEVQGEGSLGVLVPPRGVAGFRLASRLQARRIAYRVAVEELEAAGRPFPPGTIFVPYPANEPSQALAVEELVQDLGLASYRLGSGYLSGKLSLGSDEVVTVSPARIGLVGGRGTSPPDHGALWFLFDRLVDLPHSRLDADQLSSSKLDEFDVLILPDGEGYGELPEAAADGLVRWVRRGGFLVAIDGAVPWLRELGLCGFEEWQPEAAADGVAQAPLSGRLATPGAVLAAVPSPGHALVGFLRQPTAVLARGDRVLLASGDPRRDLLVARKEEAVLSGFAWPEAVERLEGSLLVGLEPQEEGWVLVFANNPAFRLLWRTTMPILLHAVLHGPSLAQAGFLD